MYQVSSGNFQETISVRTMRAAKPVRGPVVSRTDANYLISNGANGVKIKKFFERPQKGTKNGKSN